MACAMWNARRSVSAGGNAASALNGLRAGPPSHRLRVQLAADQHPPDLAGAGADLVELGVAPQAPGRVFVGVADAAERLDRLARHPGRLLGRIQDRAGGGLSQRARMVAAIARLADGVDVGA